jgi:hypothetical protein
VVRTTWVACWLGGPYQSYTPAWRSRGRVLPTTQILTNAQVTCGSPCLGHVSPIHSPQICHMSRNDSSVQLPTVCQLSPSTSTYDPATSSYDPATSATVQTVWIVQSAIFFCLFDNLNKTRYLTHPMSV